MMPNSFQLMQRLPLCYTFCARFHDSSPSSCSSYRTHGAGLCALNPSFQGHRGQIRPLILLSCFNSMRCIQSRNLGFGEVHLRMLCLELAQYSAMISSAYSWHVHVY